MAAVRTRTLAIAAVGDALAVVVFAGVGRRSHDESSGVTGVLATAAPFLCALVVAWVVGLAVARRRVENPGVMLSPEWGVNLALGTTALGMLARRLLWDRGTALAFVVVTAVFLVAAMAGWRTIRTFVLRQRGDARSPAR